MDTDERNGKRGGSEKVCTSSPVQMWMREYGQTMFFGSGKIKRYYTFADGHWDVYRGRLKLYVGRTAEYYREYRSKEFKNNKTAREKNYARCRRWNKSNPEKVASRRRKYYLKRTPEQIQKHKQYDIRYRETDRGKDQHRINEHKRRARKTGNGGDCNRSQWLGRAEYYGWRCAYCGYSTE